MRSLCTLERRTGLLLLAACHENGAASQLRSSLRAIAVRDAIQIVERSRHVATQRTEARQLDECIRIFGRVVECRGQRSFGFPRRRVRRHTRRSP